MKKLIAIFVVLSLVSCGKGNHTFSTNIEIEQGLVKKLMKNIKEKDLQVSEILYIGKEKNRVKIDKPIFEFVVPNSIKNYDSLFQTESYKNYNFFSKKYKVDINKKLEIINSKNTLLEFDENKGIYLGVNEYDKNSNEYSEKIFYSSFPIFFKNISRDTLDVQSVNGYLFISLEAKDRKGNWKPINEKPFVCGTGITSKIVLPPNEIIITSMFHYTGNYKTKFRLKFSDFVSREFDGSINEEQLR